MIDISGELKYKNKVETNLYIVQTSLSLLMIQVINNTVLSYKFTIP